MKKFTKQINFIYDIIIKDVSLLGSLVFFLFIIGFEFLQTHYFFAIFLIVELILSYLITMLLRYFFYKERPKKQKHTNFIEKIDAASFPSMHSMRTSLLFFSMSFFYSYLIGLYFFLIWFGVAFSRIYLKKHDWYDLLGGFVIGYLIFVSIKFMLGI